MRRRRAQENSEQCTRTSSTSSAKCGYAAVAPHLLRNYRIRREVRPRSPACGRLAFRSSRSGARRPPIDLDLLPDARIRIRDEEPHARHPCPDEAPPHRECEQFRVGRAASTKYTRINSSTRTASLGSTATRPTSRRCGRTCSRIRARLPIESPLNARTPGSKTIVAFLFQSVPCQQRVSLKPADFLWLYPPPETSSAKLHPISSRASPWQPTLLGRLQSPPDPFLRNSASR